MKKLAVVINKIEPSQASLFVVKNLNTIWQNYPRINTTVFHNDWGNIGIVPLFGMLQIRELWCFDGVAIATNLDTAKRVLNAPLIEKRYLYVWDLEWITRHYQYSYLASIYLNPKLELIARSEWHANILTKLWKPPAAIIEDFNHESIVQLL